MFFRELWSPGLNWDANKSSVRGHVTKKTKCSGFKTWRWTQQSETCYVSSKQNQLPSGASFPKKMRETSKNKKMREVKNERHCAQRLSLKKMLRHDDIYFLTSYIMYALWSLWSVLTFWVERGESTQCVHQSKLQWQSCQEMGKNFEACSRLTIFSPKYDHLWGFYRALFRPLRVEIEMLPSKIKEALLAIEMNLWKHEFVNVFIHHSPSFFFLILLLIWFEFLKLIL